MDMSRCLAISVTKKNASSVNSWRRDVAISWHLFFKDGKLLRSIGPSLAMTSFYLPVLYIVADSNILIGPMSNSDVVSPGSCSTASVLELEIHSYTTSLVVKPT